ncbi:MAG: HD domain-containing protein [Selenomonadaceae bacterium]|nr:HD domain-containing protein [Selenomonadaceae bacterium]MDY2684632.1 HD domain-containing protein [Selenomonadaceae bacterium]
MLEPNFVQDIAELGGRCFLVGGWVRDHIRGVPAHDKDYMVSGVAAEAFEQTFPKAKKVGKAFPVYLVEIDGRSSEVAFARIEKKTGPGYTGFSVDASPKVTLLEDLCRRDTTMNAMAIELIPAEGRMEHRLWDPYGGQGDIAAKTIRAVSAHFCEDPVRALRAARQAAQFGFSITEDTYALMRKCRDELCGEPSERIQGELSRALETRRPSVFFRALQRAGLLEVTFPEIHALIGKTQPAAFHPEGDAFEHTMLVLDTVSAGSRDKLVRFCALTHDLGKGVTPSSMLPHHYGHEEKGVTVLEAWNRRMTLPRDWRKAARFVITEHMRAGRLKHPGKIVRLLLSIESAGLTVDGFRTIVRADHHGLPYYLEHATEIVAALHAVRGDNHPDGMRGPAVGDWVLSRRIARFKAWKKTYFEEGNPTDYRE